MTSGRAGMATRKKVPVMFFICFYRFWIFIARQILNAVQLVSAVRLCTRERYSRRLSTFSGGSY